jgi:hypothetical protein
LSVHTGGVQIPDAGVNIVMAGSVDMSYADIAADADITFITGLLGADSLTRPAYQILQILLGIKVIMYVN